MSSHSSDIHWPGSHDGPPPDVPKCGFLGNDPNCQYNGIEVQKIHPSSANDDCQYMLMLTLFLFLTFGCFMFIFYYVYCK